MNTDHFYFKQTEPNQSCLLVLRQIILQQDVNISESIKWGIPCFSFYKKMFCFLSTEKKSNQPYILIVNGNQINHPSLEQGDRKQMKVLRVNPNEDLDIESIKTVLNLALDLYKSGVIKFKK